MHKEQPEDHVHALASRNECSSGANLSAATPLRTHTTTSSAGSLNAHKAVLHADFAPGVVPQHSLQRVRRSAALSHHFRCFFRGFARLAQLKLSPKVSSIDAAERYFPWVSIASHLSGELGESAEGMLRHIAEGLFSLHARDMPKVFGVSRFLHR